MRNIVKTIVHLDPSCKGAAHILPFACEHELRREKINFLSDFIAPKGDAQVFPIPAEDWDLWLSENVKIETLEYKFQQFENGFVGINIAKKKMTSVYLTENIE